MPVKPSPEWRPSASRQALEMRAKLLTSIREFFAARNVLEVETPILSGAGNTDPNIEGMSTDSFPPHYLRTSPEYPMKRLLASGMTDIYEMGRVFRAAESGTWHNPEFTLLEWYHSGWGYLQLAEEVIELVQLCGGAHFDSWQIVKITYRDLFLKHTGLDPELARDTDWASLAQERGIRVNTLDDQQWLDLVITHLIQPSLRPDSITVVYDYPANQAALARVRMGAHPVAERFEVYLGQAELANGYQELGDAREQLKRLEQDNRLRQLRGQAIKPIDQHLLQALEHGFPECSGVALGVDRLLMRLLELHHIDSVLAFPINRA